MSDADRPATAVTDDVQIRQLAPGERPFLRNRLRGNRWLLLTAFRDALLLLALAGFVGWIFAPVAIDGMRDALFGDGGAPSAIDSFRLVVATAVGIAIGLTFRTTAARVLKVVSDHMKLRRDLREGLVEEKVHRIERVLLLGAADGNWFGAILEDAQGRSVYIEALPDGHVSEELVASFPPHTMRFEEAMHSGVRLRETRNGPFQGVPGSLRFPRHPSTLPPPGVVVEVSILDMEMRLLSQALA